MKSIWQSFKNKGFIVCLCLSVFLFGGGIVLGLVTPHDVFGGVSGELASSLSAFEQFVAPFKFTTVMFIFFKNVLSVALCFALSPFFLLVPFLTLSFNGWLVGLVGSIVIGEHSVGFVLAGLLPHGIVEVPALLIGSATAFYFGAMVWGAIFSEKRRQTFAGDFRRCLKWLAVAVALLLVAAVVETYVTPLFLGVN